MNTANETVVSDEMMCEMRKAGLGAHYEPVPKELEEKANRLLNGRAIADMDDDMKRKLRNRAKRLRRAGVPGYG